MQSFFRLLVYIVPFNTPGNPQSGDPQDGATYCICCETKTRGDRVSEGAGE